MLLRTPPCFTSNASNSSSISVRRRSSTIGSLCTRITPIHPNRLCCVRSYRVGEISSNRNEAGRSPDRFSSCVSNNVTSGEISLENTQSGETCLKLCSETYFVDSTLQSRDSGFRVYSQRSPPKAAESASLPPEVSHTRTSPSRTSKE